MSREYVLEAGDRRVRGSTLRVGATYLNGRGERSQADTIRVKIHYHIER